MAEKPQPKKINTIQTANYLLHVFQKARQRISGKSVKGTPAYNFEVDFSYMLDDILRGPRYLVPMVVGEANALIERMNKHADEEAAKKAEAPAHTPRKK